MFSLSKDRRVRRALGLETLEGRNAPSHFGVLATAAETLHHHGTRPEHPAAAVAGTNAAGHHGHDAVDHDRGAHALDIHDNDKDHDNDKNDDRGGRRHDDPPGHH